MFARINIPDWGVDEWLAGIRVLLSSGCGNTFFGRLSNSITIEFPDHEVHLTRSGREALIVAFKSLGLAKGARIAVTAYLCPSVLTALRAEKIHPVAVDCLPFSFRFDPESLKEKAGKGSIDAILAPNTYGSLQDLTFLKSLGLPVIEDAAYQGGLPNSANRPQGNATIWSFNFKAIKGVGGGVAITSKQGGDKKLKSESKFRINEVKEFLGYGLRSMLGTSIPRFLPGARRPTIESEDKFRNVWKQLRCGGMSELQAAVAFAQWENRSELVSRYISHNKKIYSSLEVSEIFEVLCCNDGVLYPHLFPVVLQKKYSVDSGISMELRKCLYRIGVQTEESYPVILGSAEDFPNSCDLAGRLVLIPCGSYLPEHVVNKVGEAISTFSIQ